MILRNYDLDPKGSGLPFFMFIRSHPYTCLGIECPAQHVTSHERMHARCKRDTACKVSGERSVRVLHRQVAGFERVPHRSPGASLTGLQRLRGRRGASSEVTHVVCTPYTCGVCGRVIVLPKPLGDNRRPRLHRPCRDVRSHSTLKGGLVPN